MPHGPMLLTERFQRDLPTEYLAVVVMIALAMVIPGQPSSSMLAIIGTLGLFAAISSRWSLGNDAVDRVVRLASFGTAFLVAYSLWVHSNPLAELVLRPYATELLWAVPLAAIAGWTFYAVRRIDVLGDRSFRIGIILCLVAIGWSVAAEGASANLSPEPPIDVIDMHVAGAEALWAGLNPYTDISVLVSNPYAEDGESIVGYFYTPSVLVTYAASWRVFGDTRWASVIAVGVFMTMLLWPVLRGSRRFALAVVSTVTLFVANHSFELMINSGWTDFLALPFLLGSATVWRRYPAASAVLLGAALSTKEYFIVLLPLLLLVADPDRWRRLAYAGGIIVLTYLPFAVMDLGVLVPRVFNLVGHDRPDSLGLNGYGISVPTWLSVLIAVACSAYVARRVKTLSTMYLGFASVMAVVFLTGVQAFANYWIALTGVVLIAVWLWLRGLDAHRHVVLLPDRREAVS